MAFDFPATPTLGQQFTSGGITYVWNGYAWDVPVGGVIGNVKYTAATTAPSLPSAGDLWYDLSTGGLSVYVNDGNSSQWVQVAPIAPPPPPVLRQDVISQVTIGAPVTEIIIPFPAGYSSFDLKIIGLVPDTACQVNCRISNDGGATYLATGYYGQQMYGYAATTAGGAQSNIDRSFLSASNIAGYPVNANFTFAPGPNTVFAAQTFWFGQIANIHSDGTPMVVMWNWRQVSSGNRITHIRLFPDAGVSFVAGKLTLIGIT